MSETRKIVGQNINKVRNNMPYRKFSEEIHKKTGVKIGVATLQQYVTATREPRSDKLEIIAKYAEKPVSWFYQDNSSDTIAKEKMNSNDEPLYSIKSNMLPEELFEIKTPYLILAKEIQESGISPDEAHLMINTIKTLKKGD